MTGAGSDQSDPQEGEEESEVQFLFDLYHEIGERLCKRLGHDWETVTGHGTTAPNSIKFDRCQRCSATRNTPGQFGDSTSGGNYTIRGKNDDTE